MIAARAQSVDATGPHRNGAPAATMRVGVVSTYPPRICGIGTFSRDLRDALLVADGVSAVDIAAIVRDEAAEGHGEVVTRIRQDQRGDYAAAARVLERRGDDVVVIQHEYGIFGGDDGAHILSLAAGVRQPIVLTLHTVLSAPSVRQAETLRALCGLATLVCVFTETARRMIVAARLVPPERVRVVPHGGPPELLPRERAGRPADRPLRCSRPSASSRRARASRSRSRRCRRSWPATRTALYVIAGQTHPEVAKRHGEEYRISLERLTRDLGLSEHVVFDDRFLELDDLSEMLAETTIYLTPYKSREQIVSGALTFAVVAGCATVSTPYYYAEDLLASGAGVLVGFDDPGALASAVTGLLDDPDRLERTRAEARAVGARLAWPEVGRQTAAVLSEAIALGPPSAARVAPPATLPRARLSHLLTMVDDAGIIQHADGVVPQRASGYCTDDVARLAIVALGLARTTGAEGHHRMLARSIGFLRYAWSPEARGMRNFMSYDRRWLDAPHCRRSPRTRRLGAGRGRRGEPGRGPARAERGSAAGDADRAVRAALAARDGVRGARPRPRRRRRAGRRRDRRPAPAGRNGSRTSSGPTRRTTGTGRRTSWPTTTPGSRRR